MPELSICIPTYNYAHFLSDAVGSVMRQGLTDFEIVIGDNASEDDTEAVVSGFANPHIQYFRNDRNLGSQENGNRCLAHARGRFIKFLCADDVLVDGMVRKQLEILRQRREVTVVTCNMLVTNNNLQVEKEAYFFPGSCKGKHLIDACLSGFNNYIGGPTNVMFRKEDARGITSDPNYSWLADLKYYFQLLQRGDYMNIDTAGCFYRRHASTDTAMNCPPEIRIPEYLRLMEEFDGWNALSSAQAIRLGGLDGWREVRKHLLRISSPARIWNAMSLIPEVLRMRQ